MGSPILHIHSEGAIEVNDPPSVNDVVARAMHLGCPDLAAHEAEEVECSHIIVYHTVDANVVHDSSGIFPEERVSYTRRWKKEEAHWSPLGGLSRAQ